MSPFALPIPLSRVIVTKFNLIFFKFACFSPYLYEIMGKKHNKNTILDFFKNKNRVDLENNVISFISLHS